MSSRRRLRLTDPAAAGVVLCVFWAAMLASLQGTSPTFDEIPTAAAGYTYWRLDDYRLLPEHGNLPQRIVALPLAWSRYRFPSADSDTWRTADAYGLGDQWFYRMGNDATDMVRRGRAVSGLLAVALGALVWWWSRQLFGRTAAMVSLLACVLNPTLLANGALMASDTAVALFLLAACFAIWSLLQRLSTTAVIASGLALGGLFLSKRSAVIVVPIVVVMLAARLLDGRPATGAIGATRFEARGHRKALVLAGSLVGPALIAWMLIWASYGFRYGVTQTGGWAPWCSDPFEALIGSPSPKALLDRVGLRPEQQSVVGRLLDDRAAGGDRWTCASKAALAAARADVLDSIQASRLDALASAPPPAFVPRVLDFARRHRLFPEAFVYGHAQIWRYSRQRGAFFDGDVSALGWRSFFPYTFLVKTPLGFLGLLMLALVAGLKDAASAVRSHRLSWRNAVGAPTLPLWAALGLYWIMVIFSHLNIGHRYILPTYPPLFVLCGVVARGWGEHSSESGRGSPAPQRRAWVVASLVVLLAAEVAYRFPNYLAFFNPIAGGPSRAYRHLVDSSLDWGQDLPGVKHYIQSRRPAESGPPYLSYFGTASPAYYGIAARPLRSYPNWDEDASPALRIVDVPREDADTTLADLERDMPDYEIVGTSNVGGSRRVALLLKPSALRLAGGLYFVSATMLQPLYYQTGDSLGPWGPWSDRYERAYQEVGREVAPLLQEDRLARAAAVATRSWPEWQRLLDEFRTLRFARLTAFLRHREPDDNVNFSILVYRLTTAEVGQALLGPPAEIGPDVTLLLGRP